MNKLEKEDPIPCIKCITLPICISELTNYKLKYSKEDMDSIIMEVSSYMYFNRLRDKCSLVSEYMFDRNYVYYERLSKVVSYMLNIINERDSNSNE